MSLELVTTHEAVGVSRLTERYRKPVISALLASWLGEAQAVELAFYDLLTNRSPATAEGPVLDLLGKIVGQPRQGRSDDQYRLWIAARILVNRSSGLPSQLLAIAVKLTGQTAIELREYAQMAVIVYCQSPIVGADGVEVAKLLRLAKAAGVQLQFVWFDTVAPFRFSTSGGSAFSSPRGLSAGRFAAVSDGRAMHFLEPAPEPEPGDEDEAGGGGFLLVL
jgi:hypothetical protein